MQITTSSWYTWTLVSVSQQYKNLTKCVHLVQRGSTSTSFHQNVTCFPVILLKHYSLGVGQQSLNHRTIYGLDTGAVVVVIVWQQDLQLTVQSVTITTNVVSSNPVHGKVCSIQHYVMKFVSDLRQVDGFLCVLHQ